MRALPLAGAPLLVGVIAVLLLQNSVPVAAAVATGMLVDRLEGVIPAEAWSIATLFPVLIFVGVLLAGYLLDVVRVPLFYLVKTRIDSAHRSAVARLAAASATVAPLEDPHVQDLLRLTSAEPENWTEESPGGGALAVLALLGRYFGVVAAAGVLASYDWWLVPVLLVPVLVGRSIRRRQLLRINRLWVAGLPEGRRGGYWQEVASSPADGKELRVFGFGDLAVKRMMCHLKNMLVPGWRLQLATMRAQWLEFVLHAAPLVLIYVVALYRLAVGEGTVGAVAAVLAAAYSVIATIGAVREAFQIEGSIPVVQAYDELRRMLPSVTQAVLTEPTEHARPPAVVFHGVSFAYPGSKTDVIDGLDLHIRPGELLAIVGMNGAGKSTLIKLMTGLYVPTAGRITVDGVDLVEMDAQVWRQRLFVVFQDFVRYQLSALENVVLSRPRSSQAPARIDAVARQAGFDAVVERLPAGWDTLLTRSRAGGVELSGGQWQQLALARALYAVRAGARLLVLDEPTAHLDVRTEYDLFERLEDRPPDCTVVLISHRLATVRRADRIVVLDGGRIAESGSHDELLVAGGMYAEMFAIQAERFARGFEDRLEQGELR